jgi:enoyl-CoA hydratase
MAFLLTDIADRIATVTINRPDKLNALNKDVIAELGATFAKLHADTSVAVIILTGAGRAFVAGADIAEISAVADTKGGLAEVSRFGSNVFTSIERGPKPCIAAVNGFALGGGLELALACHVRIASSSAKFGLPEVKLGLIPGYGGTQRLPRLVGTGNALQMILTAGMVDADRALAMGLVQQVCTPEGLMPAAQSMAKEMAAQGPLALAHAIAAVNEGASEPLDKALAIEGKHFDAVGRTADGREGTSAFLEKRAPNFRGA